MHVDLALSPRYSEKRLLVPLGNTVHHRLPLVLQRDRVVVVAIGALGVDHHLSRASLLRGDLEGLLLAVRVVALVLIWRQDGLGQPTHILRILSGTKTSAVVAVFHLLLRQNRLIVLLRHLLVCFLYDCVKRVEVGVPGGHRLAGPRRHDTCCHHALLLRKRIVLSGHVLLLPNQTIQTLDVLGTQLVVLHIAIGCLRVGRAARHVLELNMIRVEVLDDTYVVALLVWTRVLHQHAAVAVLLHVRRHLRPVEATRARLLVSDVVEVLARRAALADGAYLVLVLDWLELVILAVVHAVVEGLEADARAGQLLLLLLMLVLPLICLVHRSIHLQRLAHVRRRRLEVVDLMLGWDGPTDWGADRSELVVLRHALARLPLHRERGDARQLP